jgi:hypothetical protein
MRRLLSSRVLSLVLSLWVPLFMSGAESVVRCPTHDGTAVAGAQGGAGASAAHDHGSSHSGSGDQGESHSCLCPGPGCCPPAVAVVPGSHVPMAQIVAVHAAVTVSTLDRFESENDHVLPFATAPPLGALAPTTSLPV